MRHDGSWDRPPFGDATAGPGRDRRRGSGGRTAGTPGAGPPSSGELSVTVLLDEPIGTIRPAIYSQFAEHIGGVIYDGIWVGPDSKIANIDGIRQAIVDHVKQLGPVVVRWPGGCFADKYHWRDGIGPPSKRPRRFGRWREETEANQFGTHEFIRFCRLCGVEPYFAANVGTGSPEEFQQWVEYCNAPAGSTTLADERAANGASASRSASGTGASATRAGAAGASSSPRIIAASIASSPNGCRSTACRST